jgi:hypothetical protein
MKKIIILFIIFLIFGCSVERKTNKAKPKRYLIIQVTPYNYNYYYYKSRYYTIPLRRDRDN